MKLRDWACGSHKRAEQEPDLRVVAVELCAGTACVSLSAMAGRLVAPLVGYMGSKRRWRRELATSVFGWGEPTEVHLFDAGPWGNAWICLEDIEGRRKVCRYLEDFASRGRLPEIWEWLAEEEMSDHFGRAAQYLCLQARAATGVPVWWEVGDMLRAPNGGRGTQAAGQRVAGRWRARERSGNPGSPGQRGVRAGGMWKVETIIERIHALPCFCNIHVWDDDLTAAYMSDPGRLVHTGDGRTLRVLFDPPYLNSPRYSHLMTREQVVSIATAWSAIAERIAVCEAEPIVELVALGWDTWQLAPREWVTSRGCAPPPSQLPLPLV